MAFKDPNPKLTKHFKKLVKYRFSLIQKRKKTKSIQKIKEIDRKIDAMTNEIIFIIKNKNKLYRKMK